MSLRLLAFLSLAACGASPESITPVQPLPSPPRLIADGHELRVVDAPDCVRRNALLLVRAGQPIAGTHTHPLIGLVRVITSDGATRKVCWEAGPYQTADAVRTTGLPIEMPREDTRLRAGNALGTVDSGDCDGKPPILQLGLGFGEQVAPGLVYELLEAPLVDEVNNAIINYKVAGYCTIREDGLAATSARCEVQGSPAVSPHHCRSIKLVRLVPTSNCERPPCPVPDPCRAP